MDINSKSGFTLTEVIVAVAALAIFIAAIAVVALEWVVIIHFVRKFW